MFNNLKPLVMNCSWGLSGYEDIVVVKTNKKKQIKYLIIPYNALSPNKRYNYWVVIFSINVTIRLQASPSPYGLCNLLIFL